MKDYSQPLTDKEKLYFSCWAINPHPDGKPWTKCCGECAYRRNKDGWLNGRSRVTAGGNLPEDDGRFFCAHRAEDGCFNRVCAGFAAFEKMKE